MKGGYSASAGTEYMYLPELPVFCVSHVQGNICSMPLLACCALIGGTSGCMVYGSLSGNAGIIGKGACL